MLLSLFAVPTLHGVPVKCVLRRRWHSGCVIVNKEARHVMEILEYDVKQLENCKYENGKISHLAQNMCAKIRIKRIKNCFSVVEQLFI